MAAVSVQKASGAYFTPDDTVRSLVSWAVRSPSDRMIDPSCGDGRFLTAHGNSVGVELDPDSFEVARARAPRATIYQREFFSWALRTHNRYDCAAGNPPFIRYQRFAGQVRQDALLVCRRQGVEFSGLASSWAPFLVAAASLLKPGGRMAFVVPAEVGHAPYAKPLLSYFASHFNQVTIVPVREKIFSDLSEDCWLLFADGFGGSTDSFTLAPMDTFRFTPEPPKRGTTVSLRNWARWNYRLRPFLLSADIRGMYQKVLEDTATVRLGQVARVGIGYVTGANDFFHLRPSTVAELGIPHTFLRTAVRNGRSLPPRAVTRSTVDSWIAQDDPVYLLSIGANDRLPRSVRQYLASSEGDLARETYKCRNRSPWYSVPDVTVPHAFLAYMSGEGPSFVANRADCVCTNSVHAVRLTNGHRVSHLQEAWNDPFTRLSCEVEGHPLGGGMLKLEPREAARVAMRTDGPSTDEETHLIEEGVRVLRRWRHLARSQ
jgi:SAM-dependent methyltransferase